MTAAPKMLGNGFFLTAEIIAEVLGFTPTGAAALSAAPVDAVAATNTLTSNNTNVSAGNTVTVNGVVYTFRAAVADVGDVKIGADADASLTNLARAINATGGTPGTDYLVQIAHPTVSSGTVSAHAITLTARTKSAGGNALTLAKSAATLTVGGASFSGGIDGTVGFAGQFGSYGGTLYHCLADATVATSGAWKSITLGSL